MRLARFDEVQPSKEQRQRFACGQASLDRWLATQARQSMESRDAVTFLLIDDDTDSIAGYFSLSSGEVSRQATPESMSRRAPEPVPAVRMGRFAIDRTYQGQGWGAELLREALLRAVSGGTLVAARLILVDAISEEARAFYLRFGFEPSPIHPMQLMYDLRVVAASAGVEM